MTIESVIESLAVASLLTIGTIFIAVVLATVLHELGHAGAASLVGGRVLSVTIGRVGPSAAFSMGSTWWFFHLVPVGGRTKFRVSTRRQTVAAVSGGPLVNAAVGVGCLVASPSTGVVSILLGVFGGVNLFLAAVSLAPIPARSPTLLHTDGWQLGRLLVGSKETRMKRRVPSVAGDATALRLFPPGDGSVNARVRQPGARVESNPVTDRMVALTLLRSVNDEEILDGVGIARRLLEPTDDLVPDTFGPSIRAGLATAMARALVRGPVPDPAQLADADRWASMACELRPDSPSSIDTLALVRIRQGRFKEAEDLVRPLVVTIADVGERANYETTLALALAGTGRYEEARALVARARTVDSHSPILIEAEHAVGSRNPDPAS